MLPSESSAGVADAQTFNPVEFVSSVCHFTEPSGFRAYSRPSTPAAVKETVVT